MRKKIVFPFMLILAAAVASCAPPAVPAGASVHWGREWGFYWTWTRRFEGGCADWTAARGWASVDLLINSQCPSPEGLPELRDGINYASSIDDIDVLGGGYQTGRRGDACPAQIEASQIAALRHASALALSHATTEGERRVISRIDEQLRMSNGVVRRSQPGDFRCSLIHVEGDAASKVVRDVWRDGR